MSATNTPTISQPLKTQQISSNEYSSDISSAANRINTIKKRSSRRKFQSCRFQCANQHSHKTSNCPHYNVANLNKAEYLLKLFERNPQFYKFLTNKDGLDKFWLTSMKRAEKRASLSTQQPKCHTCLKPGHWTSHCKQNPILKVDMISWLKTFSESNTCLFTRLKRSNSLLPFYQKCLKFSFFMLRII